MSVSIRQYAKHRGISDTAVHKAIKQGRISKEPDGRIDIAKADKAWEENTLPPQPKRVSAAHNRLPTDQTSQSLGGRSYVEAKTANEIIKAQTNKLRFKQLTGELIDKEKVCKLVFQLSRAERDAWQSWPSRIASQMAAKLNVEAHTLQLTLEQYIHEHLLELGSTKIDFDNS